MSLETLLQAARTNADGKVLPPVESWHPENCANTHMQILRNGTWLHEGQPITRPSMVKLFSTILRKDDTGETWLVTPVEKVQVLVDAAPFVAGLVDQHITDTGPDLYFTTNVGDVVRADAAHPLRIETNPDTLEPQPFILVRGRLEALLGRAVFYQLVEWAEERDGQLGVVSHEQFFPLGPVGAHVIG